MALFVSDQKLGRVKNSSLSFNKNGVIGDKFYAKEINRSVLIASTYSYNLAKDMGIDAKFGDLGENILLDYNPYNLSIGSKIEIGEVILEITQHCTICKSLSKVDKSLPKLLKDDRGIFAKVIKDGIISINNKIKIKGV